MSGSKEGSAQKRAKIIRGTAKHCLVLCTGESGIGVSQACSPSESLAMAHTILMLLDKDTNKKDPDSNGEIKKAKDILENLLINLGFEDAGDVYRQSKKESQ